MAEMPQLEAAAEGHLPTWARAFPVTWLGRAHSLRWRIWNYSCAVCACLQGNATQSWNAQLQQHEQQPRTSEFVGREAPRGATTDVATNASPHHSLVTSAPSCAACEELGCAHHRALTWCRGGRRGFDAVRKTFKLQYLSLCFHTSVRSAASTVDRLV